MPLQKLMSRLGETGAECALIESPVNRRYFTGFHSSAGMLLVSADRAVHLLDFRYFEMAKQAAARPGLQTRQARDFLAAAREVCREWGISSLGIEAQWQPVARATRLEKELPCQVVWDGKLDRLIGELRAVKTPEERNKIAAAQQVTEAAFVHALNRIRPGVTERTLTAEIDCFFRREGAELAFETICVAGPNSSLPHGEPSAYQVQPGDFITFDMGAKLDGYCSDMTRTVALGKVKPEQRRIYGAVLEAQTAVLARLKAGMTGKDGDAIAREIISREGFGECFGHGTGHSVGLEIHESPCLNTADETILRPGMVVTVEPGIYLEGRFGVRIEDMVAVEEDGVYNFTAVDRTLLEL